MVADIARFTAATGAQHGNVRDAYGPFACDGVFGRGMLVVPWLCSGRGEVEVWVWYVRSLAVFWLWAPHGLPGRLAVCWL